MGPKMKKGAPKRSRKYKKMSSIGKITGTVCRLTHNDGILRLSLNNLIGNRRIRNIFLTLDSRANRLHDGFQVFHAADKRTGPSHSGLVHHELSTGGCGYQTVTNRLDIARGQCAFHADRLETPRIYTPATRNGSPDVNRQCVRPFGNVQLAVSRRNAVFVFHADSAVLFHAGCVDGLD